jgi:hypothetical protein
VTGQSSLARGSTGTLFGFLTYKVWDTTVCKASGYGIGDRHSILGMVFYLTRGEDKLWDYPAIPSPTICFVS